MCESSLNLRFDISLNVLINDSLCTRNRTYQYDTTIARQPKHIAPEHTRIHNIIHYKGENSKAVTQVYNINEHTTFILSIIL